MAEAALAIAIISLGVSACVAVVQIWQALFLKARFDVVFEWVMDLEGPKLSFSVLNVGTAKGGVRGIELYIDEGVGGWAIPRPGVRERVPFTLDVDETSGRFELLADPSLGRFNDALRRGRVTKLLLISTSGDRREFDVPAIEFEKSTAWRANDARAGKGDT